MALISSAAYCQAPVFDTPEQLWRDFNPESPDLEIQVLKSWREGDATFESLRFTAEREAGGKVRVFAFRGAPTSGSRLPGILHIHGGGQTASLEWVKFWTKRGYVCVSHDFTGTWADRKDVTDWGPISQGNAKKAQGSFLVLPTPRASSWYHWALVARRALTLLSYHPKVDREKLGIFGISVGGTLCWVVAGSDERVKTVVPIYGCGYNFDQQKKVWGFPDLNRDLLLYKRVLAPEAYASTIHRPLLFLDATNDFHGWMDDAYRILAQTHVTNRVAFTPRYNHHIDPDQGTNLPAWMDWQLKGGPSFPAAPKIVLRLDQDGDPLASVRPDDAVHVKRVDVFYTLGDLPPPNRYWRKAMTSRAKTAWEAKLPVLKTTQTLRTFANVVYESGVCLSTDMPRNVPNHLGTARASLEWKQSPDVTGDEPGAPFVFGRAYTDPNIARTYFVRATEPADRDAVCLNPAIFGQQIRFDIVSHYLADPAYSGHGEMSLAFEYQGDFLLDTQPEAAGDRKSGNAENPGFWVQVSSGDFTPRFRSYRAFVETQGATNSWRPVRLSLSQFRTEKGESLRSWEGLDKIGIQGVASKSNPPKFIRFRWISKELAAK